MGNGSEKKILRCECSVVTIFYVGYSINYHWGTVLVITSVHTNYSLKKTIYSSNHFTSFLLKHLQLKEIAIQNLKLKIRVR